MDWYIWLILGFGIGVVISFVICEYMAVQQSRAFDEVARKYVSTISRQRDDLLAIVDSGYVDDDFDREPSCPDCNGTGFRDLEYLDDDVI